MGVASDYVCRTRIGAYFYEARGSPKLVLVIVAIALLLDNMLLTTVVPIIPEFLYEIRHQNETNRTTPHCQKDVQSPSIVEEVLAAPGLAAEEMAEEEVAEEEAEETTVATTTVAKSSKAKGAREVQKTGKQKDLMHENVEVGVMLASKAVVQLIANPFVGPLTNKIGYSIPMFFGFVIMFFSTIIFAFSRSYVVLFFARALQGVGSSCSSVAGMGMLAQCYPDDKERGNAMGLALGGLALGVLIGPPFGGVMYEFVGKSAPFLVLSFLALLDGSLQMLVLQPTVSKSEDVPPSLMALISDPYILVASGAITFANMGMGMLEPSLPIFMMGNMCAKKWEEGVAFLPASISYLIGTNLFGPLGHKMGRWRASLIGMIVIGLALFLVPFATQLSHLVLPMAAFGFGIGMVDSSMMPELGFLVDIRHSGVYGGVYAIGDIAFCLGFAIGPAVSGSLVENVGFKRMLMGMGTICVLYCPLLYLLKNPPVKSEEEKQEAAQLMFGAEKTKVMYANLDDQVMASSLPQQQ